MLNRALIVVDFQNDFAHPQGSLYVKGAELIVQSVCDQMMEERYTTVVLSQCWHPEETSHFEKWPPHCVADTWGAELHRDIASTAKIMLKSKEYCDPDIIMKATNKDEDGYSAFTSLLADGTTQVSTGLHELLQSQDVAEIDVCGIAGDVCVDATVMDATLLGWKTHVLLPLTVSITTDGLADSLRRWAERGVDVVGANTQ